MAAAIPVTWTQTTRKAFDLMRVRRLLLWISTSRPQTTLWNQVILALSGMAWRLTRHGQMMAQTWTLTTNPPGQFFLNRHTRLCLIHRENPPRIGQIFPAPWEDCQSRWNEILQRYTSSTMAPVVFTR